MIVTALFYAFALGLIISGALVVTVRRPITAVLFLIAAFANATGLMLLLGAEFMAFILLIVYIGAVAVLFLFVVMMLDARGDDFSPVPSRSFLWIAFCSNFLVLALVVVTACFWPSAGAAGAHVGQGGAQALGRILYTDFMYPFQLAGVILLTAMTGGVVLAGRKRGSVKRQNVFTQKKRAAQDVVSLRKVESGKGAL